MCTFQTPARYKDWLDKNDNLGSHQSIDVKTFEVSNHTLRMEESQLPP